MASYSDPDDRKGLRRGSISQRERRPLPLRRTVLVLVVALLFVTAWFLLPPSWWPIVGALTTAALVPWIVLLLVPIFADRHS